MIRSQDWWDRWYLGLAKYYSTASKDPSTQVGCVIVDPAINHPVGFGYNGFPRGIEDDDRLNDREWKYRTAIHAEINCLIAADRPIKGCVAYIWPLPPCSNCAAALIQAGISRVVAPPASERWASSCDHGHALFAEAGVSVRYLAEECE